MAALVLAAAAEVQADVNGCSVLTAVDLRGQSNVTVTFGGVLGLAYSPACILVDRATTVTVNGAFSSHPLMPGRVVNGVAFPAVSSPITYTSTGSSASFVFANRGEFGYYCDAHYSSAMYGAVLVGDVDSIFGEGFEAGPACPAAPENLSGCPSCMADCQSEAWPVSWSAVPGATHYVIRYTCFTANYTYQTSNTSADLCLEMGLCVDNDACGVGIFGLAIEACVDTCCSAPVPFPLSEIPIVCGGGVCCG